MESKTFEFLPAITDEKSRCWCCASTEQHLDPETELYNGFGGWQINKDGSEYYKADSGDWDNCKKLSDIEIDASKEPNSDWRAVLYMPLRGAEYQRQNDKWVLIEVNDGFA